MVAESVLSEATHRLIDGFHPHRVILFGSQARGTGDDRSDVDLLVICPVQGSRRTLMVAMARCLALAIMRQCCHIAWHARLRLLGSTGQRRYTHV